MVALVEGCTVSAALAAARGTDFTMLTTESLSRIDGDELCPLASGAIPQAADTVNTAKSVGERRIL
ncbi:hypothetical protein [Halomicronema hongdechloris]|uniref:hypothetical protein n=1 Tax=Halomicronema hongdechloris TaxID=1209493 RepID=UPI001CEC51A6|nr:hypothetical protein [Halomicronema hongdechloris]